MTNFADRTIWTGDNLDILRGLNSASVDLIYLDSPFNSNRNYAAPVGSAAVGLQHHPPCWRHYADAMGKCNQDTDVVQVSSSERLGLVIGFVFGTVLILLIGLAGSDVFIDIALARGQLAWLTEADDYFRKDIMIPLGAVTMVFIFMLQLERKPKVELSFGTFQAVAAVTIALVSSGVINLSFSELWVAAGIILSPAIVYLGTERISCCFLDP